MISTITREAFTDYLLCLESLADTTEQKDVAHKQQDIHSQMNDAKLHALLRVLLHSQLQGYVAFRVDDCSHLPRAFSRHLQSIRAFSQAQYLQVIQACKIISEDLASANIPVLLMKGAAYIAANKKNAQGRLISDIDILVPKQHLQTVESLLLANGWQAKELDDYDEKYYRDWSHELPPYLHLETGITLDIHHNLLPGSAGKTIDIESIFERKKATDFALFVPDDTHLILHSAIHLLLNDDIEKGLRDCLDLHYLIASYNKNAGSTNALKTLFIDSGCEQEFYILMSLLNKLFKNHSLTYTQNLLQSPQIQKVDTYAEDFAKAVFPNSQYLEDSSNTMARFKVYLRGHLSKMPPTQFTKHIVYKAYRTIIKKIFGEFIFRKGKTNT